MIKCKNKLELFEHFVKWSNKTYTYGTKKGKLYNCKEGVLYDNKIYASKLSSYHKRLNGNITEINLKYKEHILGFVENNNIILSSKLGSKDINIIRSYSDDFEVYVVDYDVCNVLDYVMRFVKKSKLKYFYAYCHLTCLINNLNKFIKKGQTYIDNFIHNRTAQIPTDVISVNICIDKYNHLNSEIYKYFNNNIFIDTELKYLIRSFQLNNKQEEYNFTIKDILDHTIFTERDIKILKAIKNYINNVYGTKIPWIKYVNSYFEYVYINDIIKRVKDVELRTLLISNCNTYCINAEGINKALNIHIDNIAKEYEESEKNYYKLRNDIIKAHQIEYRDWIISKDNTLFPYNIKVKVPTFDNYTSDGAIKTYDIITTYKVCNSIGKQTMFKYNKLSETKYNIITDKGFVFNKDEFIYLFKRISKSKNYSIRDKAMPPDSFYEEFNNTNPNFDFIKHDIFEDYDIKLKDKKKDINCFIGFDIQDVINFVNETIKIYEETNDSRLKEFNKFKEELFNY